MLVAVYAPPAVYALELAAICDILDHVNRIAPTPPYYDVRIVTEHGGPVRSQSGLEVKPHLSIAGSSAAAELVIVLAAESWRDVAPSGVVTWLRQQAARAVRHGAVGNGAFLLGAAGLLDGRRVTTHWECAAELERDFPAATVENDPIFVRDGALFTSAGGVATLDLMLSLVEEDHGRDLALDLTRRLVMFMKRSGAQAQVSVQLATQSATHDPIQRAQKHVRDDIAGDLSVAALAAVAAMSPRNFARVFLNETGMRPTDFVEQTRVNLAKRMLEESALPPQQIARLCGFSGTEAARRAFRRRAGTTMAGYRAALDRSRDG